MGKVLNAAVCYCQLNYGCRLLCVEFHQFKYTVEEYRRRKMFRISHFTLMFVYTKLSPQHGDVALLCLFADVTPLLHPHWVHAECGQAPLDSHIKPTFCFRSLWVPCGRARFQSVTWPLSIVSADDCGRLYTTR